MLLRSGHLRSLLNETAGIVETWLHGSSLVTATLQHFDYQLSRLFDKARACRLTWEEFAEEHRVTEESLEAFVEAVHQELKHPPLKVSVRIPRLPPRYLTVVPNRRKQINRLLHLTQCGGARPASHSHRRLDNRRSSRQHLLTITSRASDHRSQAGT
jgi:hypothetical protein